MSRVTAMRLVVCVDTDLLSDDIHRHPHRHVVNVSVHQSNSRRVSVT